MSEYSHTKKVSLVSSSCYCQWLWWYSCGDRLLGDWKMGWNGRWRGFWATLKDPKKKLGALFNDQVSGEVGLAPLLLHLHCRCAEQFYGRTAETMTPFLLNSILPPHWSPLKYTRPGTVHHHLLGFCSFLFINCWDLLNFQWFAKNSCEVTNQRMFEIFGCLKSKR